MNIDHDGPQQSMTKISKHKVKKIVNTLWIIKTNYASIINKLILRTEMLQSTRTKSLVVKHIPKFLAVNNT